MKNIKHKSLFAMLIFGALCVTNLFLLPAPVSAQDSFAMGISRPGEFMEELRAGQTVTQQFNVSNQGFDPFDVEITVAPYYGGDTVEIDSNDAAETHTQISRWITLSTTKATIQPGESLPLKYTITVPSDPPSGGQNAIINITSFPNDGSGVGIGKALGHTVHANIIDGQTRTEANLAVHDIPTFLFSGPVSSTIRIDNTGNTDVGAKFTFSVYNYFTEDMVYTYNIGKIVSFPKSKVTQNLSWDGTPLLGIFRVDSVVEMLGETYVEQKIVVIVPIFIIILLILIIALVVVLLVHRAKARKAKPGAQKSEA